MSTMISEVYDAFRSAGVSEEKARAAATVLADSPLTRVDIGSLATKADGETVRTDVQAIKADLLKWVIGAIGFQTLVILGALISFMKVMSK